MHNNSNTFTHERIHKAFASLGLLIAGAGIVGTTWNLIEKHHEEQAIRQLGPIACANTSYETCPAYDNALNREESDDQNARYATGIIAIGGLITYASFRIDSWADRPLYSDLKGLKKGADEGFQQQVIQLDMEERGLVERPQDIPHERHPY